MNKRTFLYLLFGSLASQGYAETTVITNVNGYTLNSDRELVRFEALQFTDDRVDRIYPEIQGEYAGADTVIDGEGKTLISGLIDAHGHVLSYGRSLLTVNLVGTQSEQEAVQRVADFAAQNPDIEWILGRGWNQVLWDSNSFPTAASLDAAVGDRPVWLSRVDGHAAWGNSAAMAVADIDRGTENPDGGEILRDQAGNATGVFIDTAMGLVSSNIPGLNQDEIRFALRTAMESLAGFGLTSVHDAGVGSNTISAFKQLAETGPLPIRVNVMLSAGDEYYEQRLREGHFEDSTQTLTMNSVKIVGDGALGSRGAALIDEYSDDPGNHGLLRYNQEQLEYLMRAAMNAGFQVNTHAIGDAANMIVLDNYEKLIEETGSRNLRHRVEHAQILRFEDILRFAELGVIPSMQATHATSDKNMAQDRIGDVRIQGAYAWRKLMDAGALIANGSDFPVESPNPFFGLHASVTRQGHDNQPAGGWFPGEAMTMEEAFASFTLDAAYAGHQEEYLGSLEPGKKADFVILDRDIFAIDPATLWQTGVEQTWVDGRKVFGD